MRTTAATTPRVAPSAVVLVVEHKIEKAPSAVHAVVHFPLGFPAAPFSLGARGEWALAVPGVAALHLWLRFDGEQVFAARASGAGAAWLDGVALDGRWVVLAPGSAIRFGEAELRVLEGRAPASLGGPVRDGPVVVKRCLRWSARLLRLVAKGGLCVSRNAPRVS